MHRRKLELGLISVATSGMPSQRQLKTQAQLEAGVTSGTAHGGEVLRGPGAPEDGLGALQEEDVPDAQQVVEGQRVREQRDEPVGSRTWSRARPPASGARPPLAPAEEPPLSRARHCRTASHVMQTADSARRECGARTPACFRCVVTPGPCRGRSPHCDVTCPGEDDMRSSIWPLTLCTCRMQRPVLTWALPRNRQGLKTETGTAAAGAGRA